MVSRPFYQQEWECGFMCPARGDTNSGHPQAQGSVMPAPSRAITGPADSLRPGKPGGRQPLSPSTLLSKHTGAQWAGRPILKMRKVGLTEAVMAQLAVQAETFPAVPLSLSNRHLRSFSFLDQNLILNKHFFLIFHLHCSNYDKTRNIKEKF